MTKKRDSIAYTSPYGGEWLKTRDVRKQHAKALGLLTRLTTHEAWATATLEIQLPQSEALHHACITHFRDDDRHVRYQPHDRAALEERGVPIDDVAAAALARFGPACVRSWCAGPDELWRLHHYQLFWQQERCPTPADWLAFVEDHQAEKGDIRHRVELSLTSEFVQWLDPATGQLLPFQEPSHYPPFTSSPSGCRVLVVLNLPAGTMLLDGRLPFERADEAFVAYYRELTAALGHALSPKNFRARLSNQDGTATYDRKLPAWKP